jgi:hypothetical protein
VAHTCFNRLDIPAYKTKKQMKKMLMIALQFGYNAEFGVKWEKLVVESIFYHEFLNTMTTPPFFFKKKEEWAKKKKVNIV